MQFLTRSDAFVGISMNALNSHAIAINTVLTLGEVTHVLAGKDMLTMGKEFVWTKMNAHRECAEVR